MEAMPNEKLLSKFFFQTLDLDVYKRQEMQIEDYDRALSLDVRALVEMTIHALPLLRETKGKIIN